MRRSLILIFFVLKINLLLAQTGKTRSLVFHPVYRNSGLILNDFYYKLNNSDSVQFETLRFYISGIEFLNNDKIVWKEKSSFHLIDASTEKSFSVLLLTPQNIIYNKIKFNLGVDSITNVSGALGGDLDPTRGMYWTWQSGYINFKLEGKSNLCKTRNNQFEFHLGGYLYPDNALQTIILNSAAKEKTEIIFDLEKFISTIDLSKQNQIMSLGKEAVLLSEKVSKCFIVKQP